MKLQTQRHLKLISKTISDFEEKSSKQNSLSIAQIHATILTIIIATFSIVVMYNYNILREREIDVFKESDRINNLNFAVSCIYPSNEFPFPKNADDSVKLISRLTSLADCVGLDKNHKIFTTKDIVERASSIFSILNVVLHRYPFQEYPVEKGNVFNKTTFLQFDNVEYIRKWRKDLQKVCQALYLPIDMLLHRPQIVDALINDSEVINAFQKLRLDKDIYGHTDLHFVERNYYDNLKKALEVSNLVEHSLRRYDRFKEGIFFNYHLIGLALLIVVTFIFGVIIPIVRSKPKRFFYIWFPNLFYVLLFLYFFYVWL